MSKALDVGAHRATPGHGAERDPVGVREAEAQARVAAWSDQLRPPPRRGADQQALRLGPYSLRNRGARERVGPEIVATRGPGGKPLERPALVRREHRGGAGGPGLVLQDLGPQDADHDLT